MDGFWLLQAGAPKGGMNPLVSQLILFGGLILIFYFFMIRPQIQKQKKEKAFRDSLKKGDKVITIGGIIGKIANIEGEEVLLHVDTNTKIRILKSAISSYAVENQTEKTEKKE
jgi:preprotein translocase subunit YajC